MPVGDAVVGLAVGSPGNTVGTGCGTPVGNAVGLGLGPSVAVGEGDGAGEEGTAVGNGSGEDDGAAEVGTGVGAGVVGAGVGDESTPPPHTQHMSFEEKSSSSYLPHQ